MNPPLRFVLCSTGTLGDIHPSVEIGVRLKSHGHAVALASPAPFRGLAREQGFEFVPTLSADRHDAFLGKPELWSPARFFETLVSDLIVPTLEPLAHWVKEQPQAEELILVSDYCSGPAVHLASDLVAARRVSVWLSPVGLQSRVEPPVLPGVKFAQNLPLVAKRLVSGISYTLADRLTDPGVNAVRARLGAKPVKAALRAMVSPLASVALFPEWFASRERDWPTPFLFAGFPLSSNRPALSLEVKEFLSQGPPPVVVTFGTGMHHAHLEFEAVLAACRSLNLRTLLISPSPLGIELTSQEMVAPFIPFAPLLERASIVVHHGGMGTCAQALRAGVPQLVVPMAHDQPDNAARLATLGVAVVVERSRVKGKHLLEALSHLRGSAFGPACQRLALRVRDDGDGIALACQHLEWAARA